MPFFVIPSRRTRQPQGFARPAFGSPLAVGLRTLVCGGQYSAALGGALTFGASVKTGVESAGRYFDHDVTSGSAFSVSVPSNIGSATSASVLFVQQSTADPNQGWHKCDSSSAGNHWPYGGAVYSSALTGARWVSGASAPSGKTLRDYAAILFTIDAAGNAAGYWNGIPWVSATGKTCAPGTTLTLGYDSGSALPWDGNTFLAATWARALSASEAMLLCQNPRTSPYQLFQAEPFRIFFSPSAGGGTTTTITESVSARLKVRGSETSAPTRTESAVARRKARGAATVTAIKAEAVVGRRKVRGAATTAVALRTESAVVRVKARGATTVTHIDAGAVVESVAGRRTARAGVAVTPIRTEAVVARRQARGSDTVALTRTIAAAGRRKARGGVAAAPLVAGMITEAVAGRLRARGSSTVTTTRVEAVTARRLARGTALISGIRAALAAGRARLRAAVAGAPYVAPTLPLEVPESTRTLAAQDNRIGSSPIAADPRRLGATPTRKAPPRLG